VGAPQQMMQWPQRGVPIPELVDLACLAVLAVLGSQDRRSGREVVSPEQDPLGLVAHGPGQSLDQAVLARFCTER
jgi:hypothetical protein